MRIAWEFHAIKQNKRYVKQIFLQKDDKSRAKVTKPSTLNTIRSSNYRQSNQRSLEVWEKLLRYFHFTKIHGFILKQLFVFDDVENAKNLDISIILLGLMSTSSFSTDYILWALLQLDLLIWIKKMFGLFNLVS